MNRSSNQSGEQRAFQVPVGVEVSEIGHCLIEDRVQHLILNMAVHPINAVLYSSVIRHLVGLFEMERLGIDGTSHVEFLDERLILPPPQKLVIDKGLFITRIHVRLGMISTAQNNSHFIDSCGSIGPKRHEEF